MKQKFNVQVDFASNFDDDKRLLDRRLAKVVADSIALACVYSSLSVLLSTREVSRERQRFFSRETSLATRSDKRRLYLLATTPFLQFVLRTVYTWYIFVLLQEQSKISRQQRSFFSNQAARKLASQVSAWEVPCLWQRLL